MKFNRIFLIIFALFLATQPSLPVQAAEDAGAYPPPLTGGWRSFISGDDVRDLAFSGNFLWAGTEGTGLFRWDTRDGTYVQYTITDGLPSNGIRAVAIDEAGNVWAGSPGFGAGRFDGLNWKIYTVSDGLLSNYVNDILVDANGSIWFATGSGVSKYDGATWTNYTSANGFPAAYATVIAVDAVGNLWFGSGEGVIKFDGSNWSIYSTADGLINNLIRAIAFDQSGNAWVGTFHGVSRFDGENWTSYTIADGLLSDVINDIGVDSQGNVWLAEGYDWSLGDEFKGMLSKFDGQTWTSFTTDDGLLDGIVYSIAFDTAGNAWFGTYVGLSRFDGINWNTITSPNPFSDNHIYAVAADPRGDVWFGTSLELNHFTGITPAENYTYPGRYPAKADYSIYKLGVDGKGNLWSMGYNGLSMYDGSNWTNYGFTTPATDAYYPESLRAISGDTYGNAWFVARIGAVKFDGHTWTTYDHSDGLASNLVLDLAGDAFGNVWFATSAGVSKFDGTNWTTYTSADGLASDSTSHIAVNPAGTVWVLTGRWVNKFDGTTWTSYEIQDSGLSGTVTSMAVDLHGNLWLGEAVESSPEQMPGGVVGFDGQNWTVYSYGDYSDNYINAVAAAPDGSVWFGTNWGAREFYPLPQLAIDASNGAPGSYFNLAGSGFQSGQTLSLSINNVPLGEVSTSLTGTLDLSLDTQSAADGYYILTIDDLPGPSASFQLDAAAETLPRQGDYLLFNLPETPVYTRRGYVPLLRR